MIIHRLMVLHLSDDGQRDFWTVPCLSADGLTPHRGFPDRFLCNCRWCHTSKWLSGPFKQTTHSLNPLYCYVCGARQAQRQATKWHAINRRWSTSNAGTYQKFAHCTIKSGRFGRIGDLNMHATGHSIICFHGPPSLQCQTNRHLHRTRPALKGLSGHKKKTVQRVGGAGQGRPLIIHRLMVLHLSDDGQRDFWTVPCLSADGLTPHRGFPDRFLCNCRWCHTSKWLSGPFKQTTHSLNPLYCYVCGARQAQRQATKWHAINRR